MAPQTILPDHSPSTMSASSIIVHPDFVHTLSDPPQFLERPRPTWRELPHEVLQLVATNLEASDLCNLAAACKELRVLANDEAVWRHLCIRKFNVPLRPHPPPSWLGLYQFNHRLFSAMLESGARQEGPAPPLNLQAPILLQA